MLLVPKELLQRMLNLSEDCLRQRDEMEDAMNLWADKAAERFLEVERLKAELAVAQSMLCKCTKPLLAYQGPLVGVNWGAPPKEQA